MKPLKVAISTVGCRANQADSGFLASHLDPGNVILVTAMDQADIVLINTCCVTAEAERDCRKRARRALRASPTSRVVLVGCAINAVDGFGAQIDPRIETRKGDDALPESLAAWINDLAGSAPALTEGDLNAALLGRTRGLLKIQTGCSHHCAYCIVPKARGKERSMPPERALAEIDRFREAGILEVVLTGVQIGAWGKDIGSASLASLLHQAADRIAPGRIRLSSIEPWSVDDALIDVMAQHPRICPHLHLPLQHGDDAVLGAMRRGYDIRTYLGIVEKARQAMPAIAIGTDVILGFPGEDEPAFQKTLSALKAIAPAYLHAFTYSKRPGTRAAIAENPVPKQIAQARTRQVRSLGETLAAAYRKTHDGLCREVIIEEPKRGGVQGLTDTFVKVFVKDGALRSGALVSLALEASPKTALRGTIPR